MAEAPWSYLIVMLNSKNLVCGTVQDDIAARVTDWRSILEQQYGPGSVKWWAHGSQVQIQALHPDIPDEAFERAAEHRRGGWEGHVPLTSPRPD